MELSIAIDVLIFLGGLFIGNRLTLANERRKEFNEVAEPLFKSLELQRRTLEEGSFPINVLSENDFIEAQRRIKFSQRRAFTTKITEYVLAQNQCGKYREGIYKLENPDILISSIEALIKYLSHK